MTQSALTRHPRSPDSSHGPAGAAEAITMLQHLAAAEIRQL